METDLANGSRGVVEDIILDLREMIDPDHGRIIQLHYPPAAILLNLFSVTIINFQAYLKGWCPSSPHKNLSS